MKSGLAGIEGLSGLGELSGSMKDFICQNKELVDRILKKEKSFRRKRKFISLKI